MSTKKQAQPTPELQRMLESEPDLVDRIFDYVMELIPEIAENAQQLALAKRAVRAECGGDKHYIRRQDHDLAKRVLSKFNGRNATEIARELGVSRSYVYRVLKQPG